MRATYVFEMTLNCVGVAGGGSGEHADSTKGSLTYRLEVALTTPCDAAFLRQRDGLSGPCDALGKAASDTRVSAGISYKLVELCRVLSDGGYEASPAL